MNTSELVPMLPAALGSVAGVLLLIFGAFPLSTSATATRSNAVLFVLFEWIVFLFAVLVAEAAAYSVIVSMSSIALGFVGLALLMAVQGHSIPEGEPTPSRGRFLLPVAWYACLGGITLGFSILTLGKDRLVVLLPPSTASVVVTLEGDKEQSPPTLVPPLVGWERPAFILNKKEADLLRSIEIDTEQRESFAVVAGPEVSQHRQYAFAQVLDLRRKEGNSPAAAVRGEP